jgi:Ca2+:H+ antiporter
MRSPYTLLGATVALTILAGILHTAVSDTAGTFASAIPLLLVAPLIATGTDNLAGRLSPSVVGIVQSAFGNVAELALTVVALSSDLPDVVRVAIAGSILGNAILLGGIAALAPTLREKGRLTSLTFDRQLFTGIATLAMIAVVPIGLLSFPVGDDLNAGAREEVSLFAGVALILLGLFFIYSELQAPHRPEEQHEQHVHTLPIQMAYAFLGVGGIVAALTSDWFVAGFEPTMEKIGIPATFGALVIIPLLGNVAENYVALRYAYQEKGDASMAVIMHSVVQIATLMTGLLLVISRFVGSKPLTLQFDPLLALALFFSMIVLWMIVHDGEIEPVEAVGLLVTYGVLGAAIWVEG